jgi:hypothetical protein
MSGPTPYLFFNSGGHGAIDDAIRLDDVNAAGLRFGDFL